MAGRARRPLHARGLRQPPRALLIVTLVLSVSLSAYLVLASVRAVVWMIDGDGVNRLLVLGGFAVINTLNLLSIRAARRVWARLRNEAATDAGG